MRIPGFEEPVLSEVEGLNPGYRVNASVGGDPANAISAIIDTHT